MTRAPLRVRLLIWLMRRWKLTVIHNVRLEVTGEHVLTSSSPGELTFISDTTIVGMPPAGTGAWIRLDGGRAR